MPSWNQIVVAAFDRNARKMFVYFTRIPASM